MTNSSGKNGCFPGRRDYPVGFKIGLSAGGSEALPELPELYVYTPEAVPVNAHGPLHRGG